MQIINKNSDMSNMTRALLRKNLITQKELNTVIDKQNKERSAKKSFVDLLVEMGFVNEEDLIKVISEVFNVPIFDLNKDKIDPSVSKLITDKTAKHYGIFPMVHYKQFFFKNISTDF